MDKIVNCSDKNELRIEPKMQKMQKMQKPKQRRIVMTAPIVTTARMLSERLRKLSGMAHAPKKIRVLVRMPDGELRAVTGIAIIQSGEEQEYTAIEIAENGAGK